MKRKLPPLKTLVAFETAAKLKSFKDAGEQLHVTSSAISHQIRSLEQWLGFKLFVRTTRSIYLTNAGERYLAEVSRAFNRLEKITRQETELFKNKRLLILQTTDSFATCWLIKRLPGFYQLQTDITVQIVTYDYHEGLRPAEADVAILYGKGDWQNGVVSLLLKEKIFPVCSPGFFHENKLAKLSDLKTTVLIHDDNLGVSWEDWFGLVGSRVDINLPVNGNRGSHFNHSHLAIKAAEQGHGVALVASPLADDSINEGKLWVPFESALETEYGYYLVQSHKSSDSTDCEKFTQWISSQMSKPV